MNLSAVLMLTSSLLASGSALASLDLQPANSSTHSLSHPIHPTSWDCPEYGLNIYGNDITSYSNISSWQECGKLASTIHGPHTPIQAVSAMHTRPAATGVGLFPGARGAPMPRGAGSTTQMAE